MKKDCINKFEKLKYNLIEMQRVIIAFSGGVDSTLLLKIASETLKDNCVAVTIVSPAFSDEERNQINHILSSIKVTHHFLEIDITQIPEFIQNKPDRCYHCKKYIFEKIKEFAQIHSIPFVLEASNLDDLDDYRPGLKAIKELDIKSPFIHAGFTKKDIRLLSKELGLFTWNKPAQPCLATRIPYETMITKDILNQIKKAETVLRDFGLKEYRVRYHENIARIEVRNEDIKKIISKKDYINEQFKNLGFTYVTVDLEGYRSGSLNEVM